MVISQRGIALIKRFEGLNLEAYRCSAGMLTIGYGHTANVSIDTMISEAQANALLIIDLASAQQSIKRLVTAPLNQNQYDALTSFVFNLGATNLAGSSLLKKLNNHDYAGAGNEFQRWNRASGVVIRGLVERRAAERELFLS
ncbi:lysozyme [Rouxiella sp. T17]|uniref:lysozyme n=1 Tax=Rouxiella sp. T17 TaxID=3085684 RepID=UPI002FCA88F4